MKLHPLLFEPSEEIGTSVRSEPELPSCFKISEDLKNVVEEIDQEGGEETDFNFSLLNLNGEVLQTCSLKLHISPARSDSSMENSEVADKVPEVSETEPQSASVEPQESDGHQISINDANKEAVQDGTNVIPDDHGSDSVNAPDATVASVSNSAEPIQRDLKWEKTLLVVQTCPCLQKPKHHLRNQRKTKQQLLMYTLKKGQRKKMKPNQFRVKLLDQTCQSMLLKLRQLTQTLVM
eukprot:Filipodium_phascolosomae@DN564_c0_g1_i1.p1